MSKSNIKSTTTATPRRRRSLFIEVSSAEKLKTIAVLRGITFNAALNVVLSEALGKPVPAKAFREAQARADRTEPGAIAGADKVS